LKPATTIVLETLSQKNTSQKTGRVAQSVGSEFNPSIAKKKKKKFEREGERERERERDREREREREMPLL
jgi:hypothetical protein